MAVNFYEYLGIDRSSSTEEILVALESRQMQLLNLIESDESKPTDKALKELQRLNRIREILQDPQKRAEYDRALDRGELCPNCGSNYRPQAQFCPMCGGRLRKGTGALTSFSGGHPPASIDDLYRRELRSRRDDTPPHSQPNLREQYKRQLTGQPAHKPQTPAPSAAQAMPPIIQVRRYGRTEYYSPMDIGHEYPLRVGLFLERHGRQLPENVRVKWTTLHIASQEMEPLIRIIPSSGFIRISPAMRDVRVRKLRDTFADFKVVPLQLPDESNETCEIRIDFEYQGDLIQSLCLNVSIQQPHKFGPLQIPHPYWKRLGLAGGMIASFETVASIYQMLNPTTSPIRILGLVGGLLLTFLLIAAAVILWRGAGQRIHHEF